MKILVTGSEGNIGKILVPYLRNKGHEVFGIDIVQGVGSDYRVADINHPIELAECFADFEPEIVYHMAAVVSRVTSEKSPSLTIQTNVAGTSNVIQLCKRYDSKLIFFSTSEVYGNGIDGWALDEHETTPHPNNLYGVSKLMGEALVHYEVDKGLKAIIIRPFMFYHENETMGTHRSAIIRFVESLLKGEKITVHHDSERGWLHLDEAVEILEKIAYVKTFEIVNIGTPDIWKMEDVARLICDELRVSEDLIQLEPLPDRMTLVKCPELNKQVLLTGCRGTKILLGKGIKRVIKAVKKRI